MTDIQSFPVLRLTAPNVLKILSLKAWSWSLEAAKSITLYEKCLVEQTPTWEFSISHSLTVVELKM